MLHSFFGEEAMKLKCTDAINRPSVPAYCRKDSGPRVEPCLCEPHQRVDGCKVDDWGF